METKQSKKANLEPKRFLFAQIGLVLALGVVFAAFEWKTYNSEILMPEKTMNLAAEQDLVHVTIIPDAPPPPPLPKSSLMKVVSDKEKVIEDIEVNSEANQKTEIPVYIPPPPKEEKTIEIDEIIPFVDLHEKAEFPGGEKELLKFLAKNINYPKNAVMNDIEGIVYIAFVVEKNGEISNVELMRGIFNECDEEAMRVVKMMPKWKPGKQRDIYVRTKYYLPVKFKLFD